MNYILKPWAHQEKAINMACALPDFAFLFEQGAGKTGATINTLRYRFACVGRVMRTLILCPIVVCDNWKDEFKLHSRVGDKVHVLTGSGASRVKEFKKLMSENCIIVTNYEALQMKELFKLFQEWQPEIIIADESQRIKGHKSKRTLASIKLADSARHRYILTGTPLLNKPMDIWAQYRFLDSGESFETNFYVFRNTYFYDKNAGMPKQKYFPNWQPLPSMEAVFNRKIYAKAMRVTKDECMDLPPFVRQKIYTSMSPEQLRMYQQMKAQFVAYLADKACVATIALTKALRLQQIVSGFFVDDEGNPHRYASVPRLDALTEQLEDLVPEHKVIVWACFRENYKMIAERLEAAGIEYTFLTGGMKDSERKKSIEEFRNNPKVRVMVANQGAAGVGINLIEASYSLYYSKNFKLEDDLQSEARNYRGGSEVHKKVTRIDIVCKGSIDETITKALEAKQNMADSILNIRALV